jgi:hypothetical protein
LVSSIGPIGVSIVSSPWSLASVSATRAVDLVGFDFSLITFLLVAVAPWGRREGIAQQCISSK